MSETIFQKSQIGQHAYSLPKEDSAWMDEMPSKEELRSMLPLPEISELDLMRHFIGLSRRSIGIDNCLIPLGSCTMKYNPRINELCAQLAGFAKTHPLAEDTLVQGNLSLIYSFIQILSEITGMEGGTLVPNAGAQGEFVGVRMIDAYHKAKGDLKRKEFLIPDSAHGTNPATAALAGFSIRSIKTNPEGDLDLESLQSALSERVAGLMLTNPNTLGLFSKQILTIASLVHEAGGLLYYDGANLNPILEIARPGEMGFDVMHINLHKTFSTPHGGGGPGSGPVLCNAKLKPFLPVPRVEKKGSQFITVWNDTSSIGGIASFYGNFGIYLRAYLYAILHGKFGLRKIAEQSILNANYLKCKLKTLLKIPYPQPCMHEFVAQVEEGSIRAADIAKRILDYGFYAPTVYFPLIVKEGFLIEPAESESKRTLDQFIEALRQIMEEVKTSPETVKTAPHHMPVKRLDETRAAKEPILVEKNI